MFLGVMGLPMLYIYIYYIYESKPTKKQEDFLGGWVLNAATSYHIVFPKMFASFAYLNSTSSHVAYARDELHNLRWDLSVSRSCPLKIPF